MFKDRLAEALLIRDMKQTDLAKHLRIATSTVSNYMTGRMVPKSKRLYEIAVALGVSEAWLLGYDVPMERRSDVTKEEIIALFDQLNPDQQRAALSFLRSIVGSDAPKTD